MKQYQREIDELGRVVIPKEVRDALGFEPKKTVGITLLDDVIVITPKGAVCSICGRPISAGAKYKLCSDCVKTIKEDGDDIPVKTRSVTERCMDELGRIVLPADFRRALNIGKTGAVTLDAEDGRVLLRPIVYACANCGAIIPSGKKYRLCDNCVQQIRRNSGAKIAKVLYKEGRFHIDNVSFILPDNTYVSTVTEIELDNGMGIVSADQRVVVIVMGNEIAESAKESIESIFDAEVNQKKLSEIEEVTVAGLTGYKVMYEDYKSINIECCFDVMNGEEKRTITIWAYTEKQFGEEAIADMQSLFDQVVGDIKVND